MNLLLSLGLPALGPSSSLMGTLAVPGQQLSLLVLHPRHLLVPRVCIQHFLRDSLRLVLNKTHEAPALLERAVGHREKCLPFK